MAHPKVGARPRAAPSLQVADNTTGVRASIAYGVKGARSSGLTRHRSLEVAATL